MNTSKSSFLPLAVALIAVSSAEVSSTPYQRSPGIEIAPKYSTKASPKHSEYTDYALKESEARKIAIEQVRSFTGAKSVLARSLRVITNNGESKIFETITGQDGLTFGIKDFTSGGLLPLLKLIEKNHPGSIHAAFGSGTQVLKGGWIKERISDKNDHGLVALKEIRLGLDQILSNPDYFDEQLERYVKEAVDPTIEKFKARGYKREFSLAAMIGAANSGGSVGLERWLKQAEKKTQSTQEEVVMPEFMSIYALRDAETDEKVKATKDLLDKVFHGKTGELPGLSKLGHSGRRLRLLAEFFSWSPAVEFKELGAFGPK